MAPKRRPILVVEESDIDIFQDRCAELITDDYRLDSSSCGFVQSELYDFCSAYHAVFVDRRLDG